MTILHTRHIEVASFALPSSLAIDSLSEVCGGKGGVPCSTETLVQTRTRRKGADEMPSRRKALSLSGVAVLAFQLCMAGLAAAQQTPTDAPLAGQPSPDAQVAAPTDAATSPSTSGKLRAARSEER